MGRECGAHIYYIMDMSKIPFTYLLHRYYNIPGLLTPSRTRQAQLVQDWAVSSIALTTGQGSCVI